MAAPLNQGCVEDYGQGRAEMEGSPSAAAPGLHLAGALAFASLQGRPVCGWPSLQTQGAGGCVCQVLPRSTPIFCPLVLCPEGGDLTAHRM